jgi:hypothetical protein
VKHASLALAALAVVLSLQGLGHADAPAGVQKWEYRAIAVIGSTHPLLDDPRFGEGAKAPQGRIADRAQRMGLEPVDMKDLRKVLTEMGLPEWKLAACADSAWLFKRPRP